MKNISLIIPCKNDGRFLDKLLAELIRKDFLLEVIIVNDGSSDNTSEVCDKYNINEVKHLYSMGNGAAIKSGARVAKGDIYIFMDADGQHDPIHIDKMLAQIKQGYDMVIGARGEKSHANNFRKFANKIYNKFSSWVVGHKVSDLTSGYRIVDANKFNEFLYMLPNGFSYPTTITMAFFRAGYSISYIPISFAKREGKSHINPFRDGIKFLLIIFKICTLYSPLKIFFPISILHILVGFVYYAYTFYMYDRFTNMSALLLSNGMIVFLIGLIAEQITSLTYSKK